MQFSKVDIIAALKLTNGNIEKAAEILASPLRKLPDGTKVYDDSNDDFSADIIPELKKQRSDGPESDLDKLMTQRKKRFDELVKTNIEFMTSYESKELDAEKIAEWLQRIKKGRDVIEKLKTQKSDFSIKHQNDGGLSPEIGFDVAKNLGSNVAVNLSEAITKEMKIISKEQFETQLKITAEETVNHIIATRPKKVVLWIQKTLNRSCLWVSVQAWKHIHNYIDGIIGDAEFPRLNSDPNWKDATVVVFDDATYTGYQMEERVNHDASEHHGEIVIAIPFISENAKMHFGDELHDAIIVPNYYEMHSLSDLNVESGYEDEDDPEFIEWSAGDTVFVSKLDYTQIPIMFSHKLADRISIPNFLFALAPFFDFSELDDGTLIIDRMTLIKGCYPDNYNYNTADPDDRDNDFIQNDNSVCPFPVYKYQDAWKLGIFILDSTSTIYEVLDNDEYFL